MLHDPAISTDDLLNDFEIALKTKGQRVAKSVFLRCRRIDAGRRYTRHSAAAAWQFPRGWHRDQPISLLIINERAQLVHSALSRATARQREVAKLVMEGFCCCEIAKRLSITPSAVTQILHRLRPLLQMEQPSG